MRRLAPLLLILLSTTVAVTAYLQALDYPFISDDNTYITKNTQLAGLHLTELWRLFTEPYNPFSEFLPLRELSYWFDMKLFGLKPAAFRLHNILLYLFCLLLVYATTRELWRYFRPADVASVPWAAAAVTSLFALHPALVESVVSISGRKDVQAAMLSLFAIWLAVRARREQGLSSSHAAATLVVFVAAMLSKASAVAVAPVIALLWMLFWLDIPVPNRRRSQLLWPLASLFLAGCVSLIFAAVITSRVPFYFGIEAVTRSLAALGWLARLAVTPESRHSFYPVFEDPYLPAMVALGSIVMVAAVAGAVLLLRKRSLEGFSLAAFLLLCISSIQLIPYAPPSLASDRWLTLAVWPVMLLLVTLSWRLKPAPRTAILLVIALSWSFQTIERPRDWRSLEAVIDADLRAYPGYYMPAVYKISIQISQGLYRDARETANSITIFELRDVMIKLVEADYAVHVNAVASGRPQEAMALLWKLGVDLKQPPAQAKWNSPVTLAWRGRQGTLVAEWGYLAEHFPEDVSVRYNAGLSSLNFRNYKEAAAHLRAATESQHLPESVRGTAFKSLGFALMNSGHIAEAEAPLRAALAQPQPDREAYCLLSELYKYTNRLEEAANTKSDCRSHASNEGAVR